MKLKIPIKNDLNLEKDLAMCSGKLLSRGIGDIQLWEVDVKDTDALLGLTFVHGSALLPKYNVGQDIKYIGLDFEIDSIEHRFFQNNWVVAYYIKDVNGKKFFILESQIP